MVKIYNCTKKQIEKALDLTNRIFDDNIKWNRFNQDSKNCFTVTLKVKDSSGKGALEGYSGNRTISACWHVWGTFFQIIFNINTNARIVTAMPKKRDINDVYGIWKKHYATSGHPSLHERCGCAICEYGYIDEVNKIFENPISQ